MLYGCCFIHVIVTYVDETLYLEQVLFQLNFSNHKKLKGINDFNFQDTHIKARLHFYSGVNNELSIHISFPQIQADSRFVWKCLGT